MNAPVENTSLRDDTRVKNQLSHRELVLLRRAAEDAIAAANPRFGPFIDAVANPLKVQALVDMAMRSLEPEATRTS